MKRTTAQTPAFLFQVVVLLSIVLLSGATAVSTSGSGQGQKAEATATALTNKDVLDMLKAGLTPEVVVAKIKASTCRFDTSLAALESLEGASVPDAVIVAMVQAPAVTGTVQVKCRPADSGGRLLFKQPEATQSISTIPCGEAVEVLSYLARDRVYEIRRSTGQTGYVLEDAIGAAIVGVWKDAYSDEGLGGVYKANEYEITESSKGGFDLGLKMPTPPDSMTLALYGEITVTGALVKGTLWRSARRCGGARSSDYNGGT